jgi:threonine/homoserine/homoserine lactone efflux protein
MPSSASLLTFFAAATVLLLIPGPAVLYIVARSASQGRRAGLVSVAAVHTGTLVHVVAAVLGLSALIVASATAFSAVKLAGAAYLIWLGVRALVEYRRTPDQLAEATIEQRSMRRIFGDGVVLNILNPKTAVFFLAFVPQFVNIDAGNATVQLLVLSSLFIGFGLITDGAYAIAGGWIGSRMSASPTLARRKDLAAGSAYISLGLVTAIAGTGSRKL